VKSFSFTLPARLFPAILTKPEARITCSNTKQQNNSNHEYEYYGPPKKRGISHSSYSSLKRQKRWGGGLVEKNTIVKLHNFGKGTKMIHVNKKRKEKKKEEKDNIIYYGGNIVFSMHTLCIVDTLKIGSNYYLI
jgi:hypothetical protein